MVFLLGPSSLSLQSLSAQYIQMLSCFKGVQLSPLASHLLLKIKMSTALDNLELM